MGTSSLPRVTAQLVAASNLVGADPFRELIIGQTGAAGTAIDGQTYQDVELMTNTEIGTLFGVNSDLTNRILKARAVCNSRFSIWVISVAAAAGTEASLALLYGGTATEDKIMKISAISKEQFTFNVSVVSGEDGSAIAAKVKIGLDALESNFPATNAVLTATATLTAVDAGTIGNKYTVEHTNIPAGVTVNTNAESSLDQFTSGATDPTITGIFDNVASTRFHSILWPWQGDFDEVDDFLSPRNVISNEFLQGVAFIGYDDTQANIKALVNGTTPLNSQNLVFMGNRAVGVISGIIEPADWRVAEFCSIEGLRLTDDAPIANYVTTASPLDVIGGSGSASLALYNTPLAETSPAIPERLFDGTEQESVKDDGFTIVGVNPSVTSTIMGEVVTTYKVDSLGNPDVSFKYLNYIRTGYLALEIFFKTLKVDYSQSRLTDGDLVAGRAMANNDAIKANYARIYKRLSGADFVLTQSGGDAEKFFFENLTLSTDIAEGSVTSFGQLPIVTQIREFIMTFQVAFNIGG